MLFNFLRALIVLQLFAACTGCGLFVHRGKHGEISTEVDNKSSFSINAVAHLSSRYNSNNCEEPVRHSETTIAAGENAKVQAHMSCEMQNPSQYSEITVVNTAEKVPQAWSGKISDRYIKFVQTPSEQDFFRVKIDGVNSKMSIAKNPSIKLLTVQSEKFSGNKKFPLAKTLQEWGSIKSPELIFKEKLTIVLPTKPKTVQIGISKNKLSCETSSLSDKNYCFNNDQLRDGLYWFDIRISRVGENLLEVNSQSSLRVICDKDSCEINAL